MVAAERGKRGQRSKMVGRQDSGSGRVLAGGRIEGVNGDMWVQWRRLGVNGGGGGGQQSEAAGGDC